MAGDLLTKRQQAFVDAYTETQNATEAYRRAYDCRKWSKDSITQQAHKMTRHPKIAPYLEAAKAGMAAAVARTMATTAEHYEHTQTRVLLELHRLAYANAASIAGKMPEQLTEAEGRAIRAIEVTEIVQKDGSKGRRVKYWLYDKTRPLEMIGRTLGMWESEAPPPPPVPNDQAAPGHATEDQRAQARRRVFALLEALAVPAPLDIDADPEPPKPNGKANGHAH